MLELSTFAKAMVDKRGYFLRNLPLSIVLEGIYNRLAENPTLLAWG